jgi:hypothetical protein
MRLFNCRSKSRLAIISILTFLAALSVFLRGLYLAVLPTPFFQPDSTSYYMPAFDLIFHGSFTLSPERTPLYPLLIFCVLKISPHFFSLLVVQHAMSLGLAALFGWIAYQTFRVSIEASLALSVFVSLLPGQLTFSHHVMSEIPYCFVLVLCCWFFFRSMETSQRRWLVGLGIAVPMLILTRPIGIGIVPSIMVVFAFLPWKKIRKEAILAAALSAMLLASWGGYNKLNHGFWGLTNFGGPSFFGNTAYLLNVDRVDDARLNQILAPIYREHTASLSEGNWVRSNPEGPIAQLRKAGLIDPANKGLTRLGFLAVRSHPAKFIFDQLVLFCRFLSERSTGPQYINSKEFSMVGGLDRYWKNLSPESFRPFLAVQENDMENYFERMTQRSLYPFDRGSILSAFLSIVPVSLWLVPWAGMISGFLLLWIPRFRGQAAFLLTTIVAHIILSNLGADQTPRHAIPIEPIYSLLCFVCLFHRAEVWGALKKENLVSWFGKLTPKPVTHL